MLGLGQSRIWLLPLSIVGGAALTVFVLAYWVDASAAPDPAHALGLVFHPNPTAAANTLSNAVEATAGVLGIMLTVVAIVVELASNRYTHRVTELFVSEPRNFLVMSLFVVTAVQGLWVNMTFDYTPGQQGGFVPYTGIAMAMGLLTLCLLVLLPYLSFVFAFLNPLQILDRIHKHTLRSIARGTKKDVSAAQREAVRGVEDLGDVAHNAMQGGDKGVSMAAIDSLRELMTGYQRVRDGLPEAWFQISGELAHNADFVSMDPGVLSELGARRVWLEMKILRQYQTVFGETLGSVRDVGYVVAINTRLMAEGAARGGHSALLRLTIKFFNTYMRAAISSGDVRTAYSVCHQYRMLAQTLLELNEGVHAIEIAHHLHYYGQVSYGARLPFILETVAYDLCTLNEVAHARGASALDELLEIFLKVDEEGDGNAHEASLRGVRKAQIKLATYFMVQGDELRARRIQLDMADEDRQRLASIHEELLRVESQDYWEITDRGVNFDYLPPERKQKLAEFFGWFEPRPTSGIR